MAVAGVIMIRDHFARAGARAEPVAVASPPDAAVAAAPAAPVGPPPRKPPAPTPTRIPPPAATPTPPVVTPPHTPPAQTPPGRPPIKPQLPDAGRLLPPVLTPPGPPDAGPPDAPPPVEIPDAPPPAPPEPDAMPSLEPDVKDPVVESMTRGIREVVEEHRAVIQDCYRRAAKAATTADPIQGRVEVHIKILSSGDADDVRVVENRTGSDELGECLVAVMRTWRYPGPGEEPMEFVWPFTFRGERREHRGGQPPVDGTP